MACEAWDAHLTQQGGRAREGVDDGPAKAVLGVPGEPPGQ